MPTQLAARLLFADTKMQEVFDRHRAAERIREAQQGLGRPIVEFKTGSHQMVAVRDKIYFSDKWKSFPDFLADYLKQKIGSDWGNAEIVKPLAERHPILQWPGTGGRGARLKRQQEVYLADAFLPPIEQPHGLFMKLAYYFTHRQFGKVLTPLKVHSARLPPAFGLFYLKISKLDEKLQLPRELAPLIREQVARINVCLFCIDIGRSTAIKKSMNEAKFDALEHYGTNPFLPTQSAQRSTT